MIWRGKPGAPWSSSRDREDCGRQLFVGRLAGLPGANRARGCRLAMLDTHSPADMQIRATVEGGKVAKAMRARGIQSQPRHLPSRWILVLVLVLAGNVLYGALHASDYGQSWDDPAEADYGEAALRAYIGTRGYEAPRLPMTRLYGPVYFMLVGGSSSALHSVVPTWDAVDIRHFINFLAFQIAILGFFFLARRMLAEGPALLAALLFAYQPVLFGHGFINQKDIPLLALFILAVLFGFRLVDRMGAANTGVAAMDVHGADRSFLGDFVLGWRSVGWDKRLAFLLLSVMGLLVSIDLVWGTALLGTATSILTSAYRGEAWGPINRLFAAIAQDAHKTPLASYIDKVRVMFGWIRIVGLYMVFLPAFTLARRIVASGGGTRFAAPGVTWSLIASSLALGLAISVRPVGAMAGALVSLALLIKYARRSLLLVAGYWVAALSISYVTWPNLWEDPVRRFLQSVRLVAEFPAHIVLFRGVIHSSRELPWDYLPTLLGVQLTEPLLLLLIPGLFVASRAFIKDARGQLFLLVAFLWFLLPFLGSVVFGLPLYDNFRQVLFVLPPLFLIAGLAIDRAWSLARVPIGRMALAGILLSPGLAGIMELRPYEYIYYNHLIGGTNGSADFFPHDYWCTSYREAMEWVNETAPKGAKVAIYGPFDVAATFARADFELAPSPPRRYRADYALLCNNLSTVRPEDLDELSAAFVVKRSDVVLSVVVHAPGAETPSP